MRDEVFNRGMARLENMFNRGKLLETEVREEYFDSAKFTNDKIFVAAVEYLITTFKPFPSEPFPSVSTMLNAVMEVEGEEQTPEVPKGGPDYTVTDYCQRCGNSGQFLAEDGQAKFCGCEKGRIKRAAWRVDPHARKRQEMIQDNLRKLSSAKAPVHGLEEWNPLGFWELTAVEHEKWCDAKRDQIEEIKASRAEFEEKRRNERKTVEPDSIRRIVAETLAQVEEKMPAAEDEECPF